LRKEKAYWHQDKGKQMSLFKALKIQTPTRDIKDIKQDFITLMETCTDTPTKGDLLYAIVYYTEYSINYLLKVANTLEEPTSMKSTMTFMNSFIVELSNATGDKYYNKEHGYSIIDKSIQYALDNDGKIAIDIINDIINEINESYVEKEIEEETGV
jgi:hypothetical protein